jgi:hypothetical protein
VPQKSSKLHFWATSRVLGNATKNPQNSISANQQSFGDATQPKKSLKKFDFGGNSEIWRVSFGV